MKKIILLLVLAFLLAMPAPARADDATPPLSTEEPCVINDCAFPIETPAKNQEDIPCGQEFSLCAEEAVSDTPPSMEDDTDRESPEKTSITSAAVPRTDPRTESDQETTSLPWDGMGW